MFAVTAHLRSSELVAYARCHLIGTQFLLEADEAEIQDRYGVNEVFGLVLRVAVFDAGEPVVCEGVVKAATDRPSQTCAITSDRDAGRWNGGFIGDKRCTARQIE